MAKKILFIFMTVCLLSNAVYSQESEEEFEQDPLKDATTVAAITLGGAILGLSTLSFTSEPKEHIKNVLVGGALGLIIGVGIVAFNQATKTKDNFVLNEIPSKEFSTQERLSAMNLTSMTPPQINSLNWSWTF